MKARDPRSSIGRWMNCTAIRRPNRPKIAPDAPTASWFPGPVPNANDASEPPAAAAR